MTIPIIGSQCRVCGCSENRPCALGGGDGTPLFPCSWFDVDHTLCTNPQCVGTIPLADLMALAYLRPVA